MEHAGSACRAVASACASSWSLLVSMICSNDESGSIATGTVAEVLLTADDIGQQARHSEACHLELQQAELLDCVGSLDAYDFGVLVIPHMLA